MNLSSLIRQTLLIIILGLWLAFPAVAAESALLLESDSLRIVFEPVHGGICELARTTDNQNLLLAETGALWRISAVDGSEVTPDMAGEFLWDANGENRRALNLTWRGFGLKDAPQLEVIAVVSIEAPTDGIHWRLRLENLGNLLVREARFPRIGPLAMRPGETLAVPEWMGKTTQQARSLLNADANAPAHWDWEYPGTLSMQCLAFYDGQGDGLLLSSRDAAFLRKQFAVDGDGKAGLTLEIAHQPALDAEPLRRYEPPYDSVLSFVSGGWHGAAVEYGKWARLQKWTSESRLKKGRTAEWARQTGLWVWNRGYSKNVLAPANLLQDAAGLTVSVFWHWWHGCPYDAGFPEYLPPREGEEAFRASVAEFHKAGIHSIVYMNQRLWGMKTQSWEAEAAERYAVKGSDGKVAPEVYNTFMKVPCASMCMGTGFWRNKYAGLAEAAFGLGIDGIYMDQACSSLSCYDPTHGHPLGGGSYWMQGFEALESDIRARCDPVRQIVLAGEGCGEAWLPHLDLMLSLQVSMERYAAPGEWEPIPFFHAVYHDCVLLYGNYSSLTFPPYDDLWPKEFAPKEPLALLDRKFSTQFRLEQARSLVWGQQLTLANFTPRLLEERREEIDFLLQLAHLRAHARDSLQEGVMLAPLAFEPPRQTFPMSRLSIYAGQQDAVKEYASELPLVLSSVWKSKGGSVAVALVNISEAEQTAPIRLDAKSWPIGASGSMRKINADSIESLGAYSSGIVELDVLIPPASGCLIEFKPEPCR